MAAFSSVLLPMTPSDVPPSVVFAFVKFMSVSEMLTALMKLAPRLVMFWMVPPVPAGPVPVTVRPALAPVPLRTMPFGAPLAEMLWNVIPLAPMVVLATFSAVPVVVAIVLAVPVTLTVPPPVAWNPPPLVASMSSPPPVKLIVAPVLSVRMTAVAVPPFSTLFGAGERDRPGGVVVQEDAAGVAARVRDRARQRDVAGARSAILDVHRARRAGRA